MNPTEPTGSGPEFGNSSWTDETLPMSVRKELLDRELQKYSAARHAKAASSPQQQNKPQGDRDSSGSHPSAGGNDDEGGHGD